jgi:hypothetical protein
MFEHINTYINKEVRNYILIRILLIMLSALILFLITTSFYDKSLAVTISWVFVFYGLVTLILDLKITHTINSFEQRMNNLEEIIFNIKSECLKYSKKKKKIHNNS